MSDFGVVEEVIEGSGHSSWYARELAVSARSGHSMGMANPQQWWQTGVIYQIYPRSFQDTNGDGVGDLRGITARLDYAVALGVDAIWISPFYPSPMADFGYDVADYTNVDLLFGSLADFDELTAAAHARGLKLILDFVPNHSSDQHPWFVESRSSRTNPKRNWYLWHEPAKPGDDWRPAKERVPNNWMSHFGGSAWTFDEATQQFYCHSFLKQQPDLNWRNPEVREAMYGAMRFWLDRGVDGFRMDVLWLLIKDDEFRDNPRNPAWNESWQSHASVLPKYTADRPETHEIVREMRALLETYADRGSRVLIGEIYLPLPELVRYYGVEDPGVPQLSGANLPFNFHLIQAHWEADTLANIIREYERLLPAGAWPNYVLGNHDQSRLATRIGAAQARVAAMLLLTLRGTPTLYYGDEIGMTDVPIASDQVQDPAEKNEPGKGRGRDPERSPMLWDGSANAGFTTPAATPWLPLLSDRAQVNVAAQGADGRSILSLYRALLALRKEFAALHSGAISDVRSSDGVLSYTRWTGEQRLQIHLNLTADHRQVPIERGHILFTTLMDGAGSEIESSMVLEGGEGAILMLHKADVTTHETAQS
jgi:alpha-glucosidase